MGTSKDNKDYSSNITIDMGYGGEDRLPLNPAPSGAMERAHIRRILGLRRSTALLALYIVFFCVYLVAGGMVFATIEAPGEVILKRNLLQTRTSFLLRHPCVTGKRHRTHNQLDSLKSFTFRCQTELSDSGARYT